MSNIGQAVLAIGGAAVGFVIGGPTGALYGSQLGLLAGTALFPTQLPGVQGPRLQDGQGTVSQVGAPIPWIFGVARVGGIVIWASPIREVSETETVGGKGAPEQKSTTYTYRRSWAVLLADNEIAGVRRVWMNGKIRLDRSPQGPNESFDEFSNRMIANEAFLDQVTIYLGTETQLPDPTIESFEGTGNVPAYRGRPYVVFNDVELLPEDGQRIPTQMEFEVYTEGSVTAAATTEYSTDALYPWLDGGLKGSILNPLNIHTFSLVVGGGPSVAHHSNPSGGPWASLSATIAAKQAQVLAADPNNRASWPVYLGHSNGIQGPPVTTSSYIPGYLTGMGADTARARESVTAYLAYNAFDCDIYTTQLPAQTIQQRMTDLYVTNQDQYICLDKVANGALPGNFQVAWNTRWPDGITPPVGWDYLTSWGDHTGWLSSTGLSIAVQRLPSPPISPEDDPASEEVLGLPSYVILNGRIRRKGAWTYQAGTWRVLALYTTSGNVVTQYPLNPCRPLGHAEYNSQPFWEAAYADAVARDQMPSGLVYGVGYPQSIGYGYFRAPYGDFVDLNPVLVSDVVEAICRRAGRRVDLIADASDLDTLAIMGFQVGSVMPARSAIDSLRSVSFFDCIESGTSVKFIKRGGAPVATLTTEDLGARIAGSEVPNLSVTKKQTLELPRQVRVRYRNINSNHEVGQELSPARFDTRAESVVDVDVPAVITPEQAARAAEVLLRDSWASRYTYETALPVAWASLEPTDIVLLPVDGRLMRTRIDSVQDTLPNLRGVSLVQDDDGQYISSAAGSERELEYAGLKFYGPVKMVLLDLPPLDVTVTPDSGFYFAAYPALIDGGFRGATLYRSKDDNTYSPVGTAGDPTPIGIIGTPPAAGPTTVVDGVTSFTVDMQYGQLANRSLVDVLNGANTAALGADGRWLILQFMTVELLYGKTYRVSGLLQGRRGTEHNVGSVLRGDLFVLLTAGTLARVPLPNDDVNASLYYRVADIARPYATATPTTFTGRGEALRPFSPVQVQGVTEGDSWVFSWVRRDRLATDLDIPMSEASEDYEVEVYSGETVIRTASVDVKTWTYTPEQQITDFGSLQNNIKIQVYQVSATVGRSAPAVGVFVGQLSGPGVRSLTVEFGGSFSTTQKLRYDFSWRKPATAGVASQLYSAAGTINASAMSSIADIAEALKVALDAAWPVQVTVSRVGNTVTAVALSGTFDGGITPGVVLSTGAGLANAWVAAAPIQTGIKAVYGIDLFTPSGDYAPDESTQYDGPGPYNAGLNWEVYGMDQDLSEAIVPFYPLPQNAFYTVPAIAGDHRNRYLALSPVGMPIYSASSYVEYQQWDSPSNYGDLTGGSNAFRLRVMLTMAPGYRMQVNAAGSVIGSHYSGYTLKLTQHRAGRPDYPAGKKQRNRIRFARPSHFDIDGNVVFDADWSAGTVLFITLDGITYTHTINSTEATAVYDTDTAFQTVYTDFVSLIEAGGLYDCTAITGRIEIERNTAEVAFESSAGQSFNLTYNILIT